MPMHARSCNLILSQVTLVREAVPPPAPSTASLTVLRGPHSVACNAHMLKQPDTLTGTPEDDQKGIIAFGIQTDASTAAAGSGSDTHRRDSGAYVSAGSSVQSSTDRLQKGAPVQIIVPGVLAVLLEDVQQLGVLHDELRVLARQRKPLAALAPVPPQLVPHAHPKAPRIRPLRRRQPQAQDAQVYRETLGSIRTALIKIQGPDTVLSQTQLET